MKSFQNLKKVASVKSIDSTQDGGAEQSLHRVGSQQEVHGRAFRLLATRSRSVLMCPYTLAAHILPIGRVSFSETHMERDRKIQNLTRAHSRFNNSWKGGRVVIY